MINLYKKFFVSNQLDFESSFIANNSRKFEVAKVPGSFTILKFSVITFQSKSKHFWSNISLKNVIRSFCIVTILTWAYYDSVSQNKHVQNLNRRWHHCQNDAIFQKYACDVAMMTPSNQNLFFQKILVDSNPHAKFGVSMTLGLGVRLFAILHPSPFKVRWSKNIPCKAG